MSNQDESKGLFDVEISPQRADDVPKEDLGTSTLTNVPSDASPRRAGVFALLTAVACCVFGAKLIVLSVLGSPMPILDQWDGEAGSLYAPYLREELSFGDFFKPHNEHRIVIFRILALMHLELSGEWSPRLEMIFGAMVHVAAITLLLALLISVVTVKRRLIYACFAAFVFALPIGYENLLWGFQGQIYLSLLFGLATLGALLPARPFSPRWFCGLIAAVLSYFSFATGVAAILAVGALIGLQLATKARKPCARQYAGLISIVSVAFVMVLWAASHRNTTITILRFITGFVVLAGPTIVAAIAIQVPTVWLCLQTLRKRPEISNPAWMPVGVAIWVWIQLLLIAYGRGDAFGVRYLDILLPVYPVALLGVFSFVDKAQRTKNQWYGRVSGVVWVFSIVTAIALLGCYASILQAIDWSKSAHQQMTKVQDYLATGDTNHLRPKVGGGNAVDVSVPDYQRLGSILDDGNIRAILPPDLRPSNADNAIVQKHMWLEGRLAHTTAATVRFFLSMGPAFFAIGIGLFFAVGAEQVFRRRRRDQAIQS